MDLGETIKSYHRALDEFARGDPASTKALYSHSDEATLANPFVGPPARGWVKIAEALDYASSRFRDGQMGESKTISKIEGEGLVVVVELEDWKARVGERSEISPFTLRVTTVFRLEQGEWKIVHRHADPISTPNASRPLRAS